MSGDVVVDVECLQGRVRYSRCSSAAFVTRQSDDAGLASEGGLSSFRCRCRAIGVGSTSANIVGT